MQLSFGPLILAWILLLLIRLSTSVKINETNLIEHLTPSEWRHFVGPNASQHFGVTYLNPNMPKIGLVNFTSNQFGHHFQLDLRKNNGLFDDKFVILKRINGKSEIIDNNLWNDTDCYYHSFSPHVAALDVCNGLRGILKSNDEEYYTISPLPERFHGLNETPHVIVRVQSAVKLKDSIGKFIAVNENDRLRIRKKRGIWPPAVLNLEIAIFVDQDLYRLMAVNFESNTEKEIIRFVLAMVNAVDLLYHDPSLGRQINFILKRLEILHSDPEGLSRSNDIDRFLSDFCKWQQTENPPHDSDPLHWDHAVILTGLDLFVTGKNGKVSNQVVGLAPVAGMCTKTSSCTVNEGRHFESVYVVAHEIGHNLGMRHDGTASDNNCDPTSYLMSPTLGSGKITWSTCSHEYLEKFLQSSQAGCLFDDSGSSEYLDHRQLGRLPGERFDAHEQCVLKYGRGSVHATSQDLSEVCRDLHCQRDRYTWTSHPALEGTLCGTNKWCRSGRCVHKGLSALQAGFVPHQSIDGGWSDWQPYSDCASSCLLGDRNDLNSGSTGIMTSVRRCNNPRPENGGKTCSGGDQKYKSCSTEQCTNAPRLTLKDFANEICLRAKEYDSELLGTGYQKITSDPKDACTVWCHKDKGGTKSRGWSFPDGTTCQIKKNKRSTYCIGGYCKEFACEDNIAPAADTLHIESAERCEPPPARPRSPSRPLALLPAESETGTGWKWQPVSVCHYSCMLPGTGFKLVEGKTCKNCDSIVSIKVCHPQKDQCKLGLKSVVDYATTICTKYGQKVQRLSGLGMQLSSVPEDMDRPCRLACQDQTVQHRFYIVNGEVGWFPFGTDCARGDPDRHAFCLSGKCLDFGPDNMPLSVEDAVSHNNFSSNNRIKRSLHNYSDDNNNNYTLQEVIRQLFNANKQNRRPAIIKDYDDKISLDFDNPVDFDNS
ncbi:Metallopeptidase, catalytic domain,Thrombospondin type-1 (TSP1) repeat,Peptidase M12B [Cinara cedri]|uniref:Metallopeptidase, catalytic domain,Thrombospondin type-1 (TSP1) repeat,Peptidase M12B n=1 Tax=Cinara cedri TaxID=506608 RepID=A0A5E4LX77_9HEMI|nr:Metallopeptidase, catalytic domain,Thrombospondin type-1 (TSP1) repeat,Peptidase M12B [Cinara cedri]